MTDVLITEEVAEAAARRMRRYVNEWLYMTALRNCAHDGMLCLFVCECGSLECQETIAMPLDEFDVASVPGQVMAHREAPPLAAA